MARIIQPERNQRKVADILRKHIGDYQNQYRLGPEHKKIVSDLLHCRTAHCGGHIERCDNCGTVRITYHSCRNRHCPTCQHMPRERWLEKRKGELLPTHYFHVVFTLPHELNTIILHNKTVMLNCLFAAASKTLLAFGKHELNGTVGFIAILHTWDQKLNPHFHLHCLIAGGAVSQDARRWNPCKERYLFNKKALSVVFRGKFMNRMSRAQRCGKIECIGNHYHNCKNRMYAKKWIVDVRDPVKNPENVLEYLARYTHRVAIANSRITALNDGMVTFKSKDRKNNRIEPITITAVEFIRRFLLHSLPKGFFRIRHYGFLANRNRVEHVDTIRHLLGEPSVPKNEHASLEEMMKQLTGRDITACPWCKKGTMQLLAEIPRPRARSPNRLMWAAG